MDRPGLDEPSLCAAAVALGRIVQPGDVLLLHGSMGAGKTTFTRALAIGMRVTAPQRVRSPTFNLCLLHEGPTPLAHVDLFRLAPTDDPTEPDARGSVSAAAFESLGLHALLDHRTPSEGTPQSAGDEAPVVVVEWAELWADPPRDRLEVTLTLDPADPERRTLRARAHGDRACERLHAWRATFDEIDPRSPPA